MLLKLFIIGTFMYCSVNVDSNSNNSGTVEAMPKFAVDPFYV
jgi:hypothetical protein